LTWTELQPYLWALAAICVNFSAAGAATVHALLYKRERHTTIGWMGLVWLAPISGSLLYYLFAINRIQRRASSMRLAKIRPAMVTGKVLVEAQAGDPGAASAGAGHHGLDHLVAKVSGLPLLQGNRITPLFNGDQAYPAMLEAIRGARHSVSLLSYIFNNDVAGVEFLTALAEAHQRGVTVRVLIDALGVCYSGRPFMPHLLKEAGVPVAQFLPLGLPLLLNLANLRNHRKILVVDGCTGFTGGTNIAIGNYLKHQPKKPTKCLHFCLEGPVVAHLQHAFSVDWAYTTGEYLDSEIWFPAIEPAGGAIARGISDGPDEDLDAMPLTLIGAITSATRSIHIATPYFLPDDAISKALCVAAMRGVEVKVFVPQHNNIPPVQWASNAMLPRLLERGVRVYKSPPPFDHTKLFIVDQSWLLLGSTNWDARSLRLNFEFNVECYDAALSATLAARLDEQLTAATEITLADLAKRNIAQRFRDGASLLAAPYL